MFLNVGGVVAFFLCCFLMRISMRLIFSQRRQKARNKRKERGRVFLVRDEFAAKTVTFFTSSQQK